MAISPADHAAAFDSQFTDLLALLRATSALLTDHPASQLLAHIQTHVEVIANDVDVAFELVGA